MKTVIEALKKIQKMEPIVYGGKGDFEKLTIEFQPGIDSSEIEKWLPAGFTLPEDYVTLLNFSNGIAFFEYACKFYPFKQAVKMGLDKWMEEDYLCIAWYYEDAIYLKCDGSSRNIFVSEEGFSELRPMNMSLCAFLDASLCSGFSYFWLWGTDDYDLY